MSIRPNTLYLVVPCYNEQEVLPETARRLREKLAAMTAAGAISPDSRVAFVDDGSKDATWSMIEDLHWTEPLFSGIRLSRNRGHQNAVLAGLMTVRDRCDMAISLDADLQDDVDALDQFVAQYEAGCEVVYGVRSDRTSDTGFKRSTAQGYYRAMGWMGVELVPDHADYRLLSRRALDALAEYPETDLFLRGIVPQLGFPTGTVYYVRHERFAGESKYPLKKMLALAWAGITAFSLRPIRAVTVTGVAVLGASLLAWVICLLRLALGHGFAAAAAILLSIWTAAGLQLLGLGIVGEYVGKVHMQSKQRPRYHIQQTLF
jgi:glycosyltransferase involved in cell wall biosynthesis